MSWQEKIPEAVLKVFEYPAGGFHAMPADPSKDKLGAQPVRGVLGGFPAMHRFYNVMGMAIGFAAARYMTDILFGFKLNGSKFEKVDPEHVPPPLRPFVGVIKCDPFSNDPKDEWLTVLYKMTPAAAGAVGAVAGSGYFFKQNGTYDKIYGKNGYATRAAKGESLTPLEADTLAAYKQGELWRVAAGATAWFASASGLTFFYGLTLNTAFAFGNNAKTMAGAAEFFHAPFLRNFSNTASNLGEGPEKAFASILKRTAVFCDQMDKAHGDSALMQAAEDQFSKQMASAVFFPLFRKLGKEEREEIINSVKDIFEQAYRAHGNSPEEARKQIETNLKSLLKTYKDHGVGTEQMAIGNNGWLGSFAKIFSGKKIDNILTQAGYNAPAASHSNAGIAAVGAAGLGAAALGMAASGKDTARPVPVADISLNANDYVKALERKHEAEKPRGFVNGPLYKAARWMSDAALAVVPGHRMWSSIGLSIGGFVGLNLAKAITGRSPASGAEIKKENFPGLLQKLFHKDGSPLLPYAKDASSQVTRVNKLIGTYVFAACCAVGVMLGSRHAYAAVEKRNRNPKTLEDTWSAVRGVHGKHLILPVALTSIFGSAAGTYIFPIPGINYGLTIALRTTSMQDRNMMAWGANKLTGGNGSSYFAPKEGLEFMAKYAVYNHDKDPVLLPEMAGNVLGQIAHAAGVELKGEHIKKFIDKIQAVRGEYWEEGKGIPEAMQKEALEAVRNRITGKGLDRTLYECGIDSMAIDFTKVGGLTGKALLKLGARTKVEEIQKDYLSMVQEWRKEWPEKAVSEAEEMQAVQPRGRYALLPNAAIAADASDAEPPSKREEPFKPHETPHLHETQKEEKETGLAFHGDVTAHNGAKAHVSSLDPAIVPAHEDAKHLARA